MSNGDHRERTELRPAAAADVPRMVEIHLAAFSGFFLSFLGPRFLGLLYGEAVALGEICFVASSGGRIVGFVVGARHPGGFFKKLVRRRLIAFGLAAVPAVLRKPGTALRVVRGLLKPMQAAKAAEIATLMSIGVDPTTQGTGAGKALVLAFFEEARARGATVVDLTTDKVDNERTNAFYRALGLVVAREIVTPEGRILNEYEIDLRSR